MTLGGGLARDCQNLFEYILKYIYCKFIISFLKQTVKLKTPSTYLEYDRMTNKKFYIILKNSLSSKWGCYQNIPIQLMLHFSNCSGIHVFLRIIRMVYVWSQFLYWRTELAQSDLPYKLNMVTKSMGWGVTLHLTSTVNWNRNIVTFCKSIDTFECFLPITITYTQTLPSMVIPSRYPFDFIPRMRIFTQIWFLSTCKTQK